MFVFWLLLAGDVTVRSLVTGVIMVTITILLSTVILKSVDTTHVHVRSVWRVLWFVGIVSAELVPAAYRHILRVIAGQGQSWMFTVDLDITDEFSIALIANAITLTPGTLTVQIQGSELTIVGFAGDQYDIQHIRSHIQTELQKPFLFVKE